MDSALTSLLNQGSALGRRRACAGSGAATATRASSPYETYETADRPIAVAVGNDRLFARLCEAVGLPELPADERFATNAARVAHVDALADALEAVLRARSRRDHWVERLRAAQRPRRADQRRRRGLRAGRGARAGADRRGRRRCRSPRPPLRLGRRAPARCARAAARRSTSTATTLRAWLTATTRAALATPQRSAARAAASAWRIVFGSMKRTSSRMTSNSETSSVPRARKKSTSRCTSSSGALAPEVMPTTRSPSSHSSRTCASLSIRCASAP